MEKSNKLAKTAEKYRRKALQYRKVLLNLPDSAPRFMRTYYILKIHALEWLANECNELADEEYDKVMAERGDF